MKIAEIRKKASWPIFAAGIVFSCLILYAVISEIMIIPPSASFRLKVISKTESPVEFWSAVESFFYMSIFCFFLTKVRLPFIEDPLDKIEAWYKYQHSIQDPQNISIKYALACTLPFIVLVVAAILLASFIM